MNIALKPLWVISLSPLPPHHRGLFIHIISSLWPSPSLSVFGLWEALRRRLPPVGRGTRVDNKSLYAMDIATGSISSLPTGPLGYTMGLGFDGEKFPVTTNEVDWFFIDGTTYINAGVTQYYYPAAGGYVGLGYGVGTTFGADYYSVYWYIASAFEDVRVYSFVEEAELIVELIKEIPI